MIDDMACEESDYLDNNAHTNYGAANITLHETLGTVETHYDRTLISLPSVFQTTGNNESKYKVEEEETLTT